MDAFETILARVPYTELLAQLAEEAVELAHATLKLRRAYGGPNPTPVKYEEALANTQEEIADVLLLLEVLQFADGLHLRKYHEIIEAKLARWEQRLEVGV
jgi:NTP pyrophosphatase (non-canonical NTP hydrolase)